MEHGDDLMTAAEAAEYLGLAEQTLSNWRYKGVELPFYKLGGRVKYSKRDLDEWKAANRHEPVA